MYFRCPNGHQTEANKYYKSDSIEKAQMIAAHTPTPCDQCPSGTFFDVSGLPVEMHTYPFDDEPSFAEACPGAVPKILPEYIN